MQYEVEVGGRLRQVAIVRVPGDGFAVTVDGVTRHVDIARIDAHTLSLAVIAWTVWSARCHRRMPQASENAMRPENVATK